MTLLGQGTGVRSFTLDSGIPLPDAARSSLPRYSPKSAIRRFIATGGQASGAGSTMSVTSTMASPRTTPMRLLSTRAIFMIHLPFDSTVAQRGKQMNPFLHDVDLAVEACF